MDKTTDFERIHTVRTLVQFAERFSGHPYLIHRGRFYTPFFTAGERPAYRISTGLSDKGRIVAAGDDGQPFASQRERDWHATQTARESAPRDRTWTAALEHFHRRSARNAARNTARAAAVHH